MQDKMKNENTFRCPFCGFGVYSQRMIVMCARCGTTMIYLGKREDEEKKEEERK